VATWLLRLAAILPFLLAAYARRPTRPFIVHRHRRRVVGRVVRAEGGRLTISGASAHEPPDHGVLDRCHWTETPGVCSQRMQALGRAGVRVVFKEIIEVPNVSGFRALDGRDIVAQALEGIERHTLPEPFGRTT